MYMLKYVCLWVMKLQRGTKRDGVLKEARRKSSNKIHVPKKRKGEFLQKETEPLGGMAEYNKGTE